MVVLKHQDWGEGRRRSEFDRQTRFCSMLSFARSAEKSHPGIRRIGTDHRRG